MGLGWSLNAGGLISSTVLGTDDGLNSNKAFLSADDANTQRQQCSNNFSYDCVQTYVETFNDAFSQSTQKKETESDRYFYSFNGRSGIFRIDYLSGVAKTIPYSALKVSLGAYGVAPYKITAEDGTNYYFGQAELSGTPPNNTFSYYLTKIESADLTHTINIYYKQDDPVGQIIKNYSLEHTTIEPNSGGDQPIQNTTLINNEFVNYSFPEMPDSITSDNETILFQYIADRPDLRKSRLYRITVLNRITRETIKIIEFQQSYFGTVAVNNQRLRLDSLHIKDNTGTAIQKYGFSYNSTPLPPYYHQVGWSEHHNVDYWGYYNGADDPNLLPREFLDAPGFNFTQQEKSFYGGNRNPNPATAQACILTEIDYPTGGKTNFEYELNQVSNGYSYPNNPTDFGGLRVKKITSTADATSPPVIKSYKYYGGFNTMIESELFVYNINRVKWAQPGDFSTSEVNNIEGVGISTDPFLPLTTGIGGLVVYNDVIEYSGTEADNNGYTEYQYDTGRLPYYFFDPGSSGNPYMDGFYLNDYGNYKPLLNAKIYYGKDQNNTFKEIKREAYTYNNFNSGSFVTGMKLERIWPFIKEGYYSSFTDCELLCYGGQYCQQLLAELLNYNSAINTVGVLDVPLLVQKNETIHPSTGTGDLVTTTDYTYDSVTLQPIQEITINSKGDSLKTIYKYPIDFSGTAVYDSMVARNIIAPVVEQDNYKNSSFLESSKTNYHDWGNKLIAPQTIESKKLSNNSDSRLHFYSYDSKGNVVTYSKENDAKNTYLWDYQSSYPIAEVKNADSSSVAYTSFESDGNGNWGFGTNAILTNQGSITGKKAYDLVGGMWKNDLDPAKTYLLSFWAKAGTPGVNFNRSGGGSDIVLYDGMPPKKTVGDWNYFELTVNNAVGVGIWKWGHIANTYIDEVRLYPYNAQMTTYTYDPLIGMTSQCDPNNKITYYQYDAFGRMVFIKDQNGKILKKYCYNYAGQQEQCNFYQSDAISGDYYSQNCSSGEAPVAYHVSVPQGMFISYVDQLTANQLAQQYAQSQANQFGSCQVQNVSVYAENNHGVNITIQLHNVTSGQDYWIYVDPKGYISGDMPPGSYDITITPGSSGWYNYSVGCDYYDDGPGAITFYGVDISSSCNSIGID